MAKSLLLVFMCFLSISSTLYGQESMLKDSVTMDPTPALLKMINSEDEFDQLKGVSLLVAYYKDRGETKKLIDFLNTYAMDSRSTYAARARYWLGDFYLQTGEYDKAITIFDEVIKRYGKQNFEAHTWGGLALERKAEAYTAAKKYDQAVKTLENLINTYPKAPNVAWIRYRIASMHRSLGRYTESKTMLEHIIKRHPSDAHPFKDEKLADTCRREINELDIRKSGKYPIVHRHRDKLIKKMIHSMQKKDLSSLEELAPAENFWWSLVGSEPAYVPFSSIKPLFQSAFKDGSPVIPEPVVLREDKDKAYLYTKGWRNKHLSEEIWFILLKLHIGWQLQGMVLTESRPLPNSWLEKRELPHKQKGEGLGDAKAYYFVSAHSNPPPSPDLRFTLKAPWKSGSYMSSGKNGSMFCCNNCANLCGWNGYYYGQGGHTGAGYYAIDFTYWTNNWPQAGRNVMAVGSGIVNDINTGNGQVSVRHLGCGNVREGYRSLYAHMRNILVSVGQYVARGSWIGEVDDVGNSTGAHLHFVLYDDQNNSGNSVMPSPMEGKARRHKGVARCIKSSNSTIWTDSDGDAVPNVIDNCYNIPNAGQQDWNNNCIGDACEDADGDGVLDQNDNCRNNHNPDQYDLDGDGWGDVCDPDVDDDKAECRVGPMGGWICDGTDNCPEVPNPDQSDFDGDGLGDACDDDIDGDGIPNENDFCPYLNSTDNLDSDNDGLGDVCDNCPTVYNLDQLDANNDGEGNACDNDDTDNDGVADKDDNCPLVCNNDQIDSNNDGIGNACTPWDPSATIDVGHGVNAVKDLIELAIKFEAFKEKIPVRVGPICLSCPPEEAIQVDIVFPEFNSDMNYQVFDKYGQMLPVKPSVKGEKNAVSFYANPHAEYFLVISPGAKIKLGQEYKIKVGLEF